MFLHSKSSLLTNELYFLHETQTQTEMESKGSVRLWRPTPPPDLAMQPFHMNCENSVISGSSGEI